MVPQYSNTLTTVGQYLRAYGGYGKGGVSLISVPELLESGTPRTLNPEP